MKLVDQHIHLADTKLKIESQAIKKKALLAAFVKRPGQKMWQLNWKTGEMIEVQGVGHASVNGAIGFRIDTKPDCIYEIALNRSNAERKFKKQILTLLAK